MPNEKTYGVSYKLEVLKPPLTQAELVKARKDYPATRFCQTAIVLSRTNPSSLLVESADGRGHTGNMPPVFAQTQFEMWLQFTEQLSRTEDMPVAMRVFLGRVLNEYKAELAR